MDDLALGLRARLLPAILTALGVAFLTAGLLSYTTPVEAGPEPSETPVIVTLPPTAAPSATPQPTVGPTDTPGPTFPVARLATPVGGAVVPGPRPAAGPGNRPGPLVLVPSGR